MAQILSWFAVEESKTEGFEKFEEFIGLLAELDRPMMFQYFPSNIVFKWPEITYRS
jgi:hypothetical protein